MWKSCDIYWKPSVHGLMVLSGEIKDTGAVAGLGIFQNAKWKT